MKLKKLRSGLASLLVLGSCYSINASAELKVCSQALQSCNYGASVALSSCLTLTYNPASGVTQSYCTSKYAKLQNQCTAAAAQCTETYVLPKAKLVSILYLPPGDRSNVGHTTTTSSGTTETHGSFYSYTNTKGFSASMYGITIGNSVSINQSSGTDSSITTGVQNSSGTTWSTSGNPIDHSKDILTIWLNPIITEAVFPVVGEQIPTVTEKGMTVVYTSLGNSAYDPAANNLKGDQVVGTAISSGSTSLISIPVSGLQNPTTLLPSQLVSRTNSDGSIVAGLLSLCANRIPESQCTVAAAQTNACGCTASDFAFLIKQHPFFNPAIANQTVAAINAVDPNQARFVPVKDSTGYDLAIPIQAGVTKTFTISDSYNTAVTYSNKLSYSSDTKYGFSYSQVSGSGSVNWSLAQSVGKSLTTGKSNSQSVTLATSSSSCYGYINVYEDTVFHTFMFMNASNAPNPCP